MIMESESVPFGQQPARRTIWGNDFLNIIIRDIGYVGYVCCLSIL
jgi:hypothetical protein